MKTTTAVETVNAELSGFVSLASDPTMLPTFAGLSERKPERHTGLLAAAAALVVALVSRIA